MREAAFVLEQRVWIIFWQVEHISQKREAGRRFRMQGVPSGIRPLVAAALSFEIEGEAFLI